MTDHEKTERERFEAWARNERDFPLSRTRDGHYRVDATGDAWAAWQARAALDTGAVPEGWKIVPVEPVEAWVHSYANYRQGQRSEPRCESPSEYDIGVAREHIKGMLAAAPHPPASASAGNEPVGWFEDDVKRAAEAQARYEAESPRNVGNAGPVQPVAWAEFAENGNVRFWTADHARKAREELRGRALTPLYTAPPAQPVAVSDVAREVQHYIECSDNGLSKVPRGLLCRIRSALVIEAAHPDAYRQGAEMMQLRAARLVENSPGIVGIFSLAEDILAIPLPGDKEG